MEAITLVGYHFAKTGGTSIHNHATDHLGESHYAFGVHNDVRRLYTEQPLLPEYPPDKVAKLRFIFGHGVDLSTLKYVPYNNVALFTVCRHPVARFVSSYKHYLRTRRDGRVLSAREHLQLQQPSPFAYSILTRFGPLADEGAKTEEDKLISIMRGLRFVLATEKLNEQAAYLFGAVGAPPIVGKRRVYPESVDLGDLSDEEILKRNHLDLLIFETVNSRSGNAASDGCDNPFGYEPERLSKARAKLAGDTSDASTRIKDAYFRTFKYLESEGRIHATKLFLDQRGLRSARRAFAEYCSGRSLNLKFENLPARDWCYLSEMYTDLGDQENAYRAAEAALSADPESPRANFLAGRAAARARQRKRAALLLAKSVELNPSVPEAWNWLARVSFKMRDRSTAIDAIEHALKLSPNAKKMKELREKILKAAD